MRLALVGLLFGWLWIIGLSSGKTMGGFVHFVLVFAIAFGLLSLARHSRVSEAASEFLENVFGRSRK